MLKYILIESGTKNISLLQRWEKIYYISSSIESSATFVSPLLPSMRTKQTIVMLISCFIIKASLPATSSIDTSFSVGTSST